MIHKEKKSLNCIICKNRFFPVGKRKESGKYCSSKCYGQARKNGLVKNYGFKKGHSIRNNKLQEWRENGGVVWNKNIPMTEETKLKMIETKRKNPTHFSENWKKQQSERLKLQWASGNRKGGWKLSEEVKKKLSIKKKGKPRSGNPKNWKISDDIKIKMSNSHKGEKAYQWIIDRTQLKKSDRNGKSPACVFWRNQVRLRDNNKCKISNSDCRGQLEVHHILPWKDFSELRYDINNGITLCHFHHPRKRVDETNLSPYFQELVGNVKYFEHF